MGLDTSELNANVAMAMDGSGMKYYQINKGKVHVFVEWDTYICGILTSSAKISDVEVPKKDFQTNPCKHCKKALIKYTLSKLKGAR